MNNKEKKSIAVTTKDKLIETTKQLLESGANPETLTARFISSKAEVNLAMINYCFQSKDELIKIAVDRIVAEEFQKYARIHSQEVAPKEQLKEILRYVCKAMIKYQSLTKLSIPYLLLNSEISLPYDILPFIKEHFGTKKTETECKVIAFHIVYALQLIFYRSEDFYKYCGINISEEEAMQVFLEEQLNFFLDRKGE